MKRTLLIWLLQPFCCMANMSSPIMPGTHAASVFSSKNIDILSETIQINISKDFKTARFIVEYTISSDTGGMQIPLLFVAKDLLDDFSVRLDGQTVALQDIPGKYRQADSSPFAGFAQAFSMLYQHNSTDHINIYWRPNEGFSYDLNELRYFETGISKGVHRIQVSYIAKPWIDVSGWIKSYAFRYSLTPAKYWRSFGTLSVAVVWEGDQKEYSTSLGTPDRNTNADTARWQFEKMPGEFFDISWTPSANLAARILILVNPAGLCLLTAVVLFLLHRKLITAYRRNRPEEKYSPVVILGSLLWPFLVLMAYIGSYQLIDAVIGPEAGRYHGYMVFSIFLYPLILPFYWLLAYLVDRHHRSNLPDST